MGIDETRRDECANELPELLVLGDSRLVFHIQTAEVGDLILVTSQLAREKRQGTFVQPEKTNENGPEVRQLRGIFV